MEKPKMPNPLPPDIQAMMKNADEDEQDKKVRAAFIGTIDQAVDGALGLAVVAYAEARTTLEREAAVRSAAVLVCALHTIKIVIDGALPPQARGPVQEVFVRACAGEVMRHDKMLRETLPASRELRRRHLDALDAASFFCRSCERPYATSEIGPGMSHRCTTKDCDGTLVPAAEVLL